MVARFTVTKNRNMKKLLLLPIIFLLIHCDVSIRETKATDEYPTYHLSNIYYRSKIQVTVYERDGIEYRIFTNNSYDGTAVFVINHTKELLEIKLLKKKLAAL